MVGKQETENLGDNFRFARHSGTSSRIESNCKFSKYRAHAYEGRFETTWRSAKQNDIMGTLE